MIGTDIKSLSKINSRSFSKAALSIFKYQSKNNPIYGKYIKHLGVDIKSVSKIEEIPFLPIELFKSFEIKTGRWTHQTIFNSSGTIGTPSRHYIRDLTFYHNVTQRNFETFFGSLKNFEILALLPGYETNKGNSLITMMEHFIKESGSEESGFYLDDHKKLTRALRKETKKKKLLFGVSHALVDLAESQTLNLKDTMVMETGGMKGRRKEIIRDELHLYLKERLGVRQICSEYGMAELTSQGYSRSKGLFQFPPWMKILIRDVTNPFVGVTKGRIGGINVIDLSNQDTCSFIETKDLGRAKNGQKVEILGRFDNSDIRGCNLLIR